ncbi:NAD(P)-dependent dehydrogenase (short-subunit alcohol dehydrogenase family) [Crossiella equi]|uniref:NAD(P)-dependent dehydrogenase (Short-subunit alcohol dehydrogenase family) n=1 Tax=Crossiella equi TaxID=130796 RepID=A0ABS5ANR2_9PSEU|nr:oxidoreductase [Crossiella equi]MBP2478213.1 NAD(P)-dependent dehydrogenase (short-subunit alcohol dehydrogenase family) [Crossiella equi]
MTNDKRRVLVTGGSRGIGAAIARKFLAAGDQVLITARSATGTMPEGAEFLAADLRTAEGVRTLAEAVRERFGGLDVLVNNAGAARPVPEGALAVPDQEWQDSLDVNFLSAVRLDRALVPAMREQGSGVVVHISSVITRAPIPQLLHYAAAKSALDVYSRGLAIELAPFGIRVHAVLPGAVDTPGGAKVREDMVADGAPADLGGTAPLGRGGEPEDIANAVAFLASAEASWITGHPVVVDGGEYLRG